MRVGKELYFPLLISALGGTSLHNYAVDDELDW